jgi:hypothetical protein
MMNRVNPFELADKLIKDNYRIPLPCRGLVRYCAPEESSIESRDLETVELGVLLDVIKSHILKTQNERDELKRDLKEVLTSGAVREHWDSYYNNSREMERYREIKDKYWTNVNNLKN